MTHEALRPEFYNLVDQYAPVGQLCTGFEFTEGPIWHPRENFLLFSDMPGDVRRRWDANGVREVMRPANKCNGMTYDAELNLIVCEHSTSSLVREHPDGRREVLASHFEGRELNSPNDVCVSTGGSIYFTDPWYGRMPVFGVERPRELGFQGVYRVVPGREGQEPELLTERYLLEMPNGLCFSPDEKLLYINDTERALIRVFDVEPDGSLTNGRLFASGIKSELKPGVPDGMKCDAEGNVWVTAPGGVWVYNPSGTLIGKLAVPEMVANLHWGGPDWRTLYLCATHSVYTVTTKVGPRNEPFMRNAPAAPTVTASPATPPPAAPAQTASTEVGLNLDPARCALIIQDMQNDVMMDGGAFADSGSPEHARQQNVVTNIRRLADACRRAGVMVIHVWFVVEPGRARRDPQRTSVRRSGRCQGAGARHLGRDAGRGPRTETRGSCGRENAHERLGRQRTRNCAQERQARHHHRHRRLDQHVDRAHRAHRRRQGLYRGGAGRLLLDHERGLAQRVDQLRHAERRRRHQDGRGHRRTGSVIPVPLKVRWATRPAVSRRSRPRRRRRRPDAA